MQVHCDEGVATHIGPEPCVSVREGRGEASAGEHTGQPLSREITESRTPTPLIRRKATRRGAPARAPRRSGAVGDPGMCGRSLRGTHARSRRIWPRAQRCRSTSTTVLSHAACDQAAKPLSDGIKTYGDSDGRHFAASQTPGPWRLVGNESASLSELRRPTRRATPSARDGKDGAPRDDVHVLPGRGSASRSRRWLPLRVRKSSRLQDGAIGGAAPRYGLAASGETDARSAAA